MDKKTTLANKLNEFQRRWPASTSGDLQSYSKGLEDGWRAAHKSIKNLEEACKRRESTMNWWNKLSSLEKTRLCDTNIELVGAFRRHETLTGREIESLFNIAVA